LGLIYDEKEGENAMSIIMEKDEAHRIIDQMPPNATWDDLMHEIYVRETIKRGLADSKAGRTKDVKEVRAEYGLPE
jgi:predicted transcriptional regulator